MLAARILQARLLDFQPINRIERATPVIHVYIPHVAVAASLILSVMNQFEEILPPTHHVLRPHHVFLLTVFLITFKEFESKDLPPTFVLHIYRFLLNEVSEVSPTFHITTVAVVADLEKVAQPKSYLQLIEELNSGPRTDAGHPLDLLNAVLDSVNQESVLYHGLQA
jgi:hypothetical protein